MEKFNSSKENSSLKSEGQKETKKKRKNEMMIVYGVEIPKHDLDIINEIASFFGDDREKAKKILIQNYFNDKKIGGGAIKTRSGFVPLGFLLREQELAYERRLKSGDKPTINTLKVALSNRIYERPKPSGRRITPKRPKNTGIKINYLDE